MDLKKTSDGIFKFMSDAGKSINVMCPVRHIEFSRTNRKEKQQKMVITYEYALAV